VPKKSGHSGEQEQTDTAQDNSVDAPTAGAQEQASRELLAMGLDIFLLRNSLGQAARGAADAPSEEEVWAQLAERARDVSRLRAQSLQDLYLKSQILLNVIEGRGHDICEILARSIRDDAGFLLRKLEDA
jgi:hypothetical protein